MWVIELHKAEEECSFVRDAVVLGDLLLHVLLQEGHIAQEAASEGSQQLKEQLNLRVVASEGKCTTLVSKSCCFSIFQANNT